MNRLFTFGEGYRTYFLAFLAIIITGANTLGYLTDKQLDVVIVILASLGFTTIRSAIKRSN